MSLRRLIAILALAGMLVFSLILWRNSASLHQPRELANPIIIKEPANIVTRTFDRDNMPSDMPPMDPGELAVCESNFSSDARVSADSLRIGAGEAMVTITQVKITLRLDVTIWVPADATPHVIEHEEGHRQISEYFYQTADKLAAQIAAPYIGKQIRVSGTDTGAETTKLLQTLGAEITEEYGKELNPNPTQLRYDEITDHSRNDIEAKDAVAQVLKDAQPPSNPPATNPGN